MDPVRALSLHAQGERDHTYEQTGVQMYTFICVHGHIGHSAAKQPFGQCGERGCEESSYLIVSADVAHAQGCHAHDCTRWVQHDGEDHCLHLRTGLAFPYGELRKIERATTRGHLRSC